MNKQPPIFLFAFANDSENSLRLGKESDAILDALLNAVDDRIIECQALGYTTLESIYNRFDRYRERICIFHFGGHSEGEWIHLKGLSARAQDLGTPLGHLENLKLIFLNGCANQAQVKFLFDHGVKAVIATQAEVEDQSALDLSQRFYLALASGKSILKSFETAASYVKQRKQSIDIETRGIGIETRSEQIFPWGLYAADDAELDWTIHAPLEKISFSKGSYIPKFPPNFVARPEVLPPIIQSILDSGMAAIGIQGMAGIGKSVLAVAVGRDEVVETHFSDGIFWVELGQNVSQNQIIGQIENILEVVSGSKFEAQGNLFKARSILFRALSRKRCLIILDDAWESDDVEIFNDLPAGNRLLFTTRNRSIISLIGAKHWPIEVLAPKLAKSFISSQLGQPVSSFSKAALSVVDECNGLPLALALCGALIRAGNSWKDLREALQENDLKFLDHEHKSVFSSIKTSVDYLDPQEVQLYYQLAVFSDGISIPESAIIKLWTTKEDFKERHARKLVNKLGMRALLRIENKADLRCVKLHDLQQGFLKFSITDTSNLHHALLEAYQMKGIQNWMDAQDDGYFFQFIIYHLAKVGKIAVIQELLTNDVWVSKKLAHADIYSYVEDIKRADELGIPLEAISTSIFKLFEHNKPLRGNLANSFISQFQMAFNNSYGSYSDWPAPLRRLIEQSDKPDIMVFLGRIMDMEKQYSRAEKIQRKILHQINPLEHTKDYCNAFKRLAEVIDHQDEIERAISEFDHYHQALLDAMQQERQGDSTSEIFQRAKEFYEIHKLWLFLSRGKFMAQSKRYGAAKKVLADVYEHAGPKDKGRKTAALHHLGVIDVQFGRLESAEAKFRACLELRGEHHFDRRRAYEYRGIGQVYALRGNFDKANILFEKGLTISLRCADKRYAHNIRNDIIAFIDLPKYLLEKRFDTITISTLEVVIKQFYKKRLKLVGIDADLVLSTRDSNDIIKNSFWVLGQWKRTDLSFYTPSYHEVISQDDSSLTGEIVSWQVAHGEKDSEGRWHRTAGILIFDKEENLCLQVRGEKDSRGKKDISATGHIDVGEQDQEAVAREVWEELGIYIDPDRFQRIGVAYQFKKEGRPEIKVNRHLDVFSYQYQKSAINLERFSMFYTKITENERSEINASAEKDAQNVVWLPISNIFEDMKISPEGYASTIQQVVSRDIMNILQMDPES